MKIAVHITHESMKKIGGIGAVLNGLCNAKAYQDFYDKTVFYGPAFEMPVKSSSAGGMRKLLYSSHGHYDSNDYASVFSEIVSKYNADIIYCKRKLVSEFDLSKQCTVDVVNIGVNKMNHDRIEEFKYALWKEFKIKDNLYSDDWD